MRRWNEADYAAAKTYVEANHSDGDKISDVLAGLRVVVQVGWQPIPAKDVRAWLSKHRLLTAFKEAAEDTVGQTAAVRNIISVALLDLEAEETVFDFSDSQQLSDLELVRSALGIDPLVISELTAHAVVLGPEEKKHGIDGATEGRIERVFESLGWTAGSED